MCNQKSVKTLVGVFFFNKKLADNIALLCIGREVILPGMQSVILVSITKKEYAC